MKTKQNLEGKSLVRRFVLYTFLTSIIIFVFSFLGGILVGVDKQTDLPKVSFSELAKMADSGEVSKIEQKNTKLLISLKNGGKLQADIVNSRVEEGLSVYGIDTSRVEIKYSNGDSIYYPLALQTLPMIIIVSFYISLLSGLILAGSLVVGIMVKSRRMRL